MKSLVKKIEEKKNTTKIDKKENKEEKPKTAAQCCAKTSKVISGCHD
ncbi:MAG: hypothetical protein OEZ13_06740 [Spirochaetia bacterium]|nr:hypothetical protein [Spirochaetia bacterium]